MEKGIIENDGYPLFTSEDNVQVMCSNFIRKSLNQCQYCFQIQVWRVFCPSGCVRDVKVSQRAAGAGHRGAPQTRRGKLHPHP